MGRGRFSPSRSPLTLMTPLITVDWMDEAKQVVCYTYHRGWTWADFDRANDTALALYSQVSHPIVNVIDLTDSGTFALDFALKKSHEAILQQPPHIHPTVVVVGASIAVQAMGLAYDRLYGDPLRPKALFVRSLEVALKVAQTLLRDNPTGTNL